MSIEVQRTPNPNARKFVLLQIQFDCAQNFSGAEPVENHPLAAKLLALEGVYNVFWAQNFVTVNKRPETDWEPLTEQVENVLRQHFGLE
jgi:hypothetical protein